MFNNIGGKIKTLAKVICWIGIALSLISGIITMHATAEALIRGNDNALVITIAVLVSGIIVAAIGSLSSWIGSFLIYGFGELIVKATEIEKNTAEITFTANGTENKNVPLHSTEAEGQDHGEAFARALSEFYREDKENGIEKDSTK